MIWGQGNSAVWAGTFTSTLEVVNNTVAYNMWDPTYSERNWAVVVGYPEEIARPPVNLTLTNNLLAYNSTPLDGGPTGMYLGEGVNLVSEGHNLYYSRDDGEITAEFVTGRDTDFTRAEIGNGTWATFSGQGQGNVTDEPQLTSGWPGVDVRPAAGSPVIDAGSPVGAPGHDVTIQLRDASPDIGAYEYGTFVPEQLFLPLTLKGV